MRLLTQGFRVSKLYFDCPNQIGWDIPLDPTIHAALQKKYRFLGKGMQSYVFTSDDGEYVIKLFRFDKLESPQQCQNFFAACTIAHNLLSEETGLLYLHLNLSEGNLPILHCTDAIGRKYHLPLDNLRFALQKKALPLTDTLVKASKNPVDMKNRIDQFVHLLNERSKKRVLNSDGNLKRNFGFLEDRAIELDFGNFVIDEETDSLDETKKFALQLRKWLEKNAPDWVAYLDERLMDL